MVSLLIAAAIIFCMAMIIVGALHADRSFSDALSSNRTLDSKAQKYLSTLRSGAENSRYLNISIFSVKLPNIHYKTIDNCQDLGPFCLHVDQISFRIPVYL